MRFVNLAIPEVTAIEPEPMMDDRGFFARMICCDTLRHRGIPFDLAQCNNTLTRQRGTIRGMHFQRPPYAEIKIIRCVRGRILDVAVDLRDRSPTYGQVCTIELDETNRTMIVVPRGFAHGFQTLTDDVELIYFHSASYHSEAEGGVQALDPAIAIPWPLPVGEMSARDRQLPNLADLEPVRL